MVPCGADELRCRSGQCIPVEWQCDGEMDCAEGLDEWDVLCSECQTRILGKLSLYHPQINPERTSARPGSSGVTLTAPAFPGTGGVTGWWTAPGTRQTRRSVVSED